MIPNGTLTVTSPTGEHRTFRIRTRKPKASDSPPRRVIELLTGPNNTGAGSYTPFGFVDPAGRRVAVWKRLRSPSVTASASTFERLARLVEDLFRPDSRFRARGMTVVEARTCLRCNRLLTTPESLASGMGPECVGRTASPAHTRTRRPVSTQKGA